MTSTPATNAAQPLAVRKAIARIRTRLREDRPAARAELALLRDREPGWLPALLLSLNVALDDGDLAGARECLGIAEARWPDSMRVHFLRAMVHQATGDLDGAIAAAREALRRPADPRLVAKAVRLIRGLGGPRAVRETCIDDGLAESLPVPAARDIARIFDECRDHDRAAAWSRVAEMREPTPAHDATRFASYGTTRPVQTGVDWDASFVSVPAAGSDTAIVAFTGLKLETGVPIDRLHAMLQPLGCHFVALRDQNRLLFLGGHPALGADPAAASRRLRAHLASLGAKRIVVIGTSAGGLGALLYGALMRADGIVGYGAVTSVQAPFETRARTVLRRIRACAPDWIRAPIHYLREEVPDVPLLLYYGDAMEIDRRHAESLAGLPGSRLRALPGFDGHDVPGELVARGELVSELAAFIASLPTVAPDAALSVAGR